MGVGVGRGVEVGVGVGVGPAVGVGVGAALARKLTELLSSSSSSSASTPALPFPFTRTVRLTVNDLHDVMVVDVLVMETPPELVEFQLISPRPVLLLTRQLTVRVLPWGTVPPPLHETYISSRGPADSLSCACVDRLNVTKAANTSAATKTKLMSLPGCPDRWCMYELLWLTPYKTQTLHE